MLLKREDIPTGDIGCSTQVLEYLLPSRYAQEPSTGLDEPLGSWDV